MTFFAAMIQLQNKKVTVIGGGNVATRKIHLLLDTGANIEVISPNLSDSLHELVDSKKITWKKKSYEKRDTKDSFFIIAATNDEIVNQEVSSNCDPFQLVTDVSNPQLGNTIMPAVLQKGQLHIAVSTNGASPRAAQKIRDALANIINDEIESELNIISKKRKEIIDILDDPLEKKQRLKDLTNQITL